MSASRSLVWAGVLLGVGLGGFLDGIVFHQIFQLHNMLTGVVPKTSIVNVEVNMFWDGLFHLVTWLVTVIGLARLWRALKVRDGILSGRILVGAMLLGWGLFNFIEGLVDHHVLGVHHVVERLGLSIFDWMFLGSGVMLVLIGWAMIRNAGAVVTRPAVATPT